VPKSVAAVFESTPEKSSCPITEPNGWRRKEGGDVVKDDEDEDDKGADDEENGEGVDDEGEDEEVDEEVEQNFGMFLKRALATRCELHFQTCRLSC
jgi:hypothetical protein